MKKSKAPYIDSKLKTTENVTLNKVPFAVVEAYKNIRTNLISLLSKDNSKVVAISSPYASEGKSTTAVNLAITLSQLNKKVIIIDSDTRRPTIHKKLKLKNTSGISNVILKQSKLEDTIQNYSEYLDVLSAGHSVSNPSEIFSSAYFEEILLTLKENYDYIIFDTPPVNVVTDGLVIAQKCDGLVLIIRVGYTTYDAIGRALENIDMLEINLLGVIMNGMSDSFKAYYKYKYKYKHSYYNYSGRYNNTVEQQQNNN